MQIAGACVLSIMCSRCILAATSTGEVALPDAGFSVEAPPLHLLDLSNDENDLSLNEVNSQGLNFTSNNTEKTAGTLVVFRMAAEPAQRPIIEETFAIEAKSSQTGDFVVPIPAIGAGWALLIGAGMYKVGCKVLRVKG